MTDRYDDADFSGDYARDTHRGGYGDDYARERPWTYRGRGPKNYRPSDERIWEEVNERLTYDHNVDATDVEVKVACAHATRNAVPKMWLQAFAASTMS